MAVPGALNDYDCEGVAVLDGTTLNTPAWSVSELWRLWTERDYRQSVRTLPYADGQIVARPYRNALRLSLPMLITGHVTEAGVRNSNPMRGLQENVEAVRLAMIPGPTMVSLFVTKPDGVTDEWLVFPLGLRPGSVQLSVMRATFELIVPAGEIA